MTEEEKRLRKLEIVKKLRLIDDFFMTIFFNDFIEGTEEILRIILQKDDIRVLSSKAQTEIKNIWGHSVKLDILAVDSANKTYNIEVQRDDRGAAPQRARYHSSIIDTNLLDKNKDYDTLTDSFVIFITENDVIGDGLPLYYIERRIVQTGKPFGDGSNIVYVNGAYDDTKSEIGKLIHDFFCYKSKDMYNKVLSKRYSYLKETKEDEGMCKLIDDYVNDLIEDEKAAAAKLEAKNAKLEAETAKLEAETAKLEAETTKLEAELTAAKASEKRGRLEAIKRTLLIKKFSFEDIAMVFGIPVDEVRKIADEVYA